MHCYLFIGILISSVFAENLPNYFKKCSRSDPNLSICMLENAKQGVKKLEKEGDPEFQIKNLTPIKFRRFKLQASPTLNIEMENVEFYGFEKIVFKNMQLKDNKLTINGHGNVEVLADYIINGKILFLPIQGQGRINLTFVNVDMEYSANLILKDKYYKTSNDITEIKLDRLYYDLTNLFQGDPNLGPEMNRFLNDNWRDVYNEISLTIKKILTKIFTLYINGYFSKITIDHLIAD